MIESLTADLQPVRRITPLDAIIRTVIALTATVIAVAFIFGVRDDITTGQAQPIVILRGGVLLVLGMSALAAVIASARPGVGQISNGWRWALGMAALFPVTSLILMLGDGALPLATLTSGSARYCIGISVSSALLIGAAVLSWLRNGAPTALPRVGWLTGLAAGSFGTFAYALHCPSVTVHYIGIWYTLAIGLCAVLGRITVPHFVRW